MKICMPCFVSRYGSERKPSIITWGRQCDDCKKDTPSLANLIKVEDRHVR